jgi:hypothetical protein
MQLAFDHRAGHAAEAAPTSTRSLRRTAKLNALTELAAHLAGVPKTATRGGVYAWAEPKPGTITLSVFAGKSIFTKQATLVMLDPTQWDAARAERQKDRLIDELLDDLLDAAAVQRLGLAQQPMTWRERIAAAWRILRGKRG